MEGREAPLSVIDNSAFGSLPTEETRMLTADELAALRASLGQIAGYMAPASSGKDSDKAK